MAAGANNQRRHALLIGIDKYPNLGAKAQLEGCVNDVLLMRQVLTDHYGFVDDDFVLISDEKATRKGILRALDELSKRVQTDDIVVVHYAGHGSEIPDLEGDEPDGYDSTVVPHDAVRPKKDESGKKDPKFKNIDITDDEIHDWLQGVCKKTSFVTLIFDCCHSGSISREAFGPRSRQVERDSRSPEDLGRKPRTSSSRGAAAPEGPSGWLPIGDRYVLIAGCRDEELSYEYGPPDSDEFHGAMTYFLTRQMIEAKSGTTYRDAFEQASINVTSNNSRQHPQMEGARDRELFGIHDISPMRFVQVSERAGDVVTLFGGSVHGLTKGSEWAIYPPGAKSLDDEVIGAVRVTSVGAVKSSAAIESETPEGAIEAGCRAAVSADSFGIQPLRILLESASGFEQEIADLRTELEASKLLEVVEDGSGFDIQIFAVESRTDDGTEKTPIPQIKALDAPSWVCVGGDGRVNLPVHEIGSQTRSRMRENAEILARYRRTLELTGESDSALAGEIEVAFLRKDASGEWNVAEPDLSSGLVTFEEGDPIGLRVTNKHDKPLFFYVFNLTMTYGISQEYPPEGAQEDLAANKSHDLFTKEGIEWEFDDGFPFAADPDDPSNADGIEIIKVFASTASADMSVLQQDAVRSLGAVPNPLDSLFEFAAHGGSTRGFKRKEKDTESWTTATIQMRLKRKAAARDVEPGGNALQVGDLTIRSNGISGTAEILPTFSDRTRSVELTTDPLEEVLAAENVYANHALRISNVEVQSKGAGTRGDLGDGDETSGPSSIEIDVPDSGNNTGQFVMYTDESGVISWHIADEVATTRSLEGGPATRTYTIDRNAEPDGAHATRGLVSAVGQKLIKVLVFPLIDPVLGEVGDYFAGRWEASKRPYGVRTLTAENRSDANGDLLGPEDWARLGRGRSLLFVHGTFSRTHSAFSGLPEDVLGKLHQRYDGRVFAFDHFTLSHDPKENIERLLKQVPEDVNLDLDIICHSRGGLVSRTLAEKQDEFSLGSRTLNVGKIIFVASPNAGTMLADTEHVGDLIDSYTNLLNFVPDNPVTDVLDAVITVVKQLAVGALKGLDGLQSMRPGGEFLVDWINAGGGDDGAQYYALAAEYAPKHKGLLEFAKTLAMKKIFEGNNDLVVPTNGVFEENGSPRFPIPDKLVLGPDEGVAHSNFFSNEQVQEQILAWLSQQHA